MTRITSWFPRALMTGAVICVGSLAGMATASAHVHVDAEDPGRGETTIVTFRVPNESETGSPTTQFTVDLPNVASASTDVLPGWSAKLDKDVAAGTVRSITWTAGPGGGIPADQFELFPAQIALPDTDSVTFPAIQTYADGTVVHWDQPTPPGGAEPEHPAPMLELTGAAPDSGAAHEHAEHTPAAAASTPAPVAQPQKPGPDNIARAVAGGALLVAALGVAMALIRRRA
jgi:uncharacterized protein YcnI